MYLSAGGLMQLLAKNVVELRFKRKHKKQGFNEQRRMLCTNDRNLLNSDAGKRILHFVQPTHPKSYNPLAKNLVVAYDIFMQQYRTIDARTCDVIAVISTDPPTEWWTYFNANIRGMSAGRKLIFMNN